MIRQLKLVIMLAAIALTFSLSGYTQIVYDATETARLSANTFLIDTSTLPSTFYSVPFYLPATITSATETPYIPTYNSERAVLQIYGASTSTGDIGTTDSTIWIEGMVNYGTAGAFARSVTQQITQTSKLTVPAAAGVAINSTTQLGTFSIDVRGLSAIKMGVAGLNAAVTAVIGVYSR